MSIFIYFYPITSYGKYLHKIYVWPSYNIIIVISLYCYLIIYFIIAYLSYATCCVCFLLSRICFHQVQSERLISHRYFDVVQLHLSCLTRRRFHPSATAITAQIVGAFYFTACAFPCSA